MVTKGVNTWALMEDPHILNIEDFKDAFRNSGAVDRGDGTFQVTIMHDGTIRNLKSDSSRALGSFENDAMQRITGSYYVQRSGAATENYPTGAFKRTGKTRTENYTFNPQSTPVEILEHTFNSGDSSNAKVSDEETVMKNTGGQFRLLVKMNI